MFIHIQVTSVPSRVERRERLERVPDTCVAIGEAPDGLPLVLRITRERDVRGPILSVLGRTPTELPGDVTTSIETLQRLVTKQTLHDGMTSIEGVPGYLANLSIGSMLGASLFANAVGESGPLAAEEDVHHGDERVSATCAGVVMKHEEIERMLGSAASSRRLFVPLPDGRCRVVTTDSRSKGRSGSASGSGSSALMTAPARPIIFERLERVPGARFGYRHANSLTWHSEPFAENRSAYRTAVQEADSVAWWLPRHSLALALVEIAKTLSVEMHERGRVHGDIKPANLLLGENGPVAIDPLDIESGRVATVCTPSWAAPEQVTAQPVSAATDVHALGLVLARILNAVVFGEERTFIVPVGGDEKRRMKILHDPQVFIDPTSGLELDDRASKAYASFITRCTAFNPANRPKSCAHFALELQSLSSTHPLPTRTEQSWTYLGWLSGMLHRKLDLLGSLQPAWVIADSRRFA